ncbi:MAG TPA: aminotransferase class III-fold pyridoxal phosphate-dependent enzyme [Ilumatobacteraceae bacterium]|nr:aminotransferase class III-fold pyridoxal phosphate-dependent enzyme [Ilumatobacteraceae bacterium]
MIDDPIDGPEGLALWDRADRVLPGGGIYLSRSADIAGRGVLPGFIVAADGCRVTDVDRRTYIDLLCANGPNLLGYRHPEVEEAARRQAATMTSASMFPSALVEIVERLVDRYDAMTWGVVSKNGSEVVALAVRVARQHTQRPLVVGFTSAYHGNDPELAVSPSAGVLTDGTRDVLRTAWNDPEMLLALVEARHDKIAAILLNPIHQIPLVPTVDASPEFIAAIELVRDRYGVQVIVDDVRHGFRLHPDGSHRALGIMPDLMTFGKALGNGYSISALLGGDAIRRAARKILYTSTYMFETPPMHAAMKVLEIYDRDHAFDHLQTIGARLRSGILAAAESTGHRIDYSGPLAMPTLLFTDDDNLTLGRRFSREAAGLGAIFHPALNWFLSAAHTDADIDETITIAQEAFRRTPISGSGTSKRL